MNHLKMPVVERLGSEQRRGRRQRVFAAGAMAVMMTLLIAGCGGEGVSVGPASQPSTAAANSYTGPAPRDEDVLNFQRTIWDSLRASNRCGQCHSETGGQSPMFFRQDDVNTAYDIMLSRPYADRNDPSQSIVVRKVADNNHNCWLPDAATCGAVISALLDSWFNGSGVADTSKQIDLTAPSNTPPGETRSFPDGYAEFQTHLYTPYLREYCEECHSESGSNPIGSPYFASTDVGAAYEAAKPKIDLDIPANSRLVVRLREDQHNCWDPGNCEANAQAIEDAIMAMRPDPEPIDSRLLASSALFLPEGIVASGGGRHEPDAIALYEFKSGTGTTVADTSGVAPELNLQLFGDEGTDYEWFGGWGVTLRNGYAKALTADSTKLFNLLQATGEYSIEAWVVPANVSQEEADIVSYQGGPDAKNFSLAQTLYNYDFLHRSTSTGFDGLPALSTPDAAEVLQATLQHVVATYHPIDGRKIYVNGELVASNDPSAGGSMNEWDTSFAFYFGQDWQGVVRLVAIHKRALTESQIVQNFEAGVGQKFYLLFNVSDIPGADVPPQSYVLFLVEQFDSYSYLFQQPHFVNLDFPGDVDAADLDGIRIRGMRIGVNGAEAAVGQAYANMDVTLTTDQFGPLGQPLSSLGTIISLEKGAGPRPSGDEFFLTFEQIGPAATDMPPKADNLVGPALATGGPAPSVGVRTFEEISAAMSKITGVPMTNGAIQPLFETVKQQLPTVEAIDGFLSAHQMGVAQLAIQYCAELVDDRAKATTYFGFDKWDQPIGSAFGSVDRGNIIGALVTNMAASGVVTQPQTEMETELDALITTLIGSCNNPPAGESCNPGTHTPQIVKATCAAALGSAAMLVQ